MPLCVESTVPLAVCDTVWLLNALKNFCVLLNFMLWLQTTDVVPPEPAVIVLAMRSECDADCVTLTSPFGAVLTELLGVAYAGAEYESIFPVVGLPDLSVTTWALVSDFFDPSLRCESSYLNVRRHVPIRVDRMVRLDRRDVCGP
jgi:hypothetical protein